MRVGAPDLALQAPISGSEAYQLYVENTLPHLHQAWVAPMFLGEDGDYLVGPPGEGRDVAMLVRHRSVEPFMSFTSNEDYLAGATTRPHWRIPGFCHS